MTTTLAPGEVPKIKEAVSPKKKQTNAKMADEIITLLKLMNTRMELNAGKIINEEMSMVPMTRIPRTMVIAVSRATSILKKPTLTPVALAKFSSKVMAKIWS